MRSPLPVLLLALTLTTPALAREPHFVEPWRQRVAEAQAEYARNPEAFPRVPLAKAPPQGVPASPNERWAVDGLLVAWDCESSANNPDSWDWLWMDILDGAWDGADIYIYLRASGPSDSGDVQRCQQMLQQHTGRDPSQAVWFNESDDHLLDSIWIRDYGPFFITEDGTDLSIVDADYVRYNRIHDDAQPGHFAAWYGIADHEWDFATEGGNFLANGHGICLVSETILGLNPQYDTAEIEDLYHDYLGCTQLIILPGMDDVTGHVDMWMTWFDHKNLIVGEYDPSDDYQSHQLIEDAIADQLTGLVDPVTGESIQIHRVPMPDNDNQWVWRTYTNGTWIDDTFLMPVYGGYEGLQNQAIAVFEGLGAQVIPVDADVVITSAGAVHCITKTIPVIGAGPGDDDSGDDDAADDDAADDDAADDDAADDDAADDDGAGDDDAGPADDDGPGDLVAGAGDCQCTMAHRGPGVAVPLLAWSLLTLAARRR